MILKLTFIRTIDHKCFSFLTDNKSDINYIELGDKTVQELLVEHDLLITDYSSVSFDFSYMKKPVIFYHFDVKNSLEKVY